MARTVILFPGQGAQSVGMGRELAERRGSAAQAFAAASEAIGVDLQKLCFEGPEEKLARTDICQPAILAVSIAALRAIEEQLGRSFEASFAAGLSLGEYSAIVAAQTLKFPEAVRLVYQRGRFMQKACEARPGAMYSIIGLEDAQVEEACRKVRESGGQVWPANYNSPGQVVISGELAGTQKAAAICTETGARRAIQLNVAGAFHTPLMQPAAESMAKELQKVEFKEPAFPVVSNVTAQPVGGPSEIRELLVRQIVSPTRWAQSMFWCIAQGQGNFVEIGPGRVLQGLLKRIDQNCNCVSVSSAADVETFAAAAEADL